MKPLTRRKSEIEEQVDVQGTIPALLGLQRLSRLLKKVTHFERIFQALPEIIVVGDENFREARATFDGRMFQCGEGASLSGSVGSPIVVNGKVRGHLEVFSSDFNALDDETLKRQTLYLDEIAFRVAGALEKKLAEAKAQHATTVLSAIRNINRSVVREEDPVALLKGVCCELVTLGSIKAAWMFLLESSPLGTRMFECGWGQDFEPLATHIESGWVPDCCRQTFSSHQLIVTKSPAQQCGKCPLASFHRRETENPCEVMTCAIRMEATVYGYMCVSVPEDMAAIEEKESLLRELSHDLAFALRSIELKAAHQETEEALKKEALRRQVLMEACQDGICIIDQKHQVVEANQRFAEMVGCTSEEVLSLHTWDFEAFMSEEDIRANFADLTQTRAIFETQHRRKDGSMFNVEVSASGADVGGEPMVFTVSRDVTEKRSMQASLAQSDRLASMGVLAAGVAHEINNPLAYVLYNLESLNEEMPRLLDELKIYREDISGQSSREEILKRLTSMESIERKPMFFKDILNRYQEALSGVRRIQNITRALGTFSRVERDQLVPVNVHYVIECAINMAFNEIKYRARLVKDFQPIPSIMASDGCLSQVFLNLLINAAHAIPEGDVESHEIRVRTWKEEKTVCVEIRDTGEGIPEENLSRIFEPFFSTKGVGVGSGLGLAISRNIISGYGGEIEVKSELGHGSSFFIRVPFQLDRVVRPSQVPPANYVDEIRGRVLVVDDEAGICRAIKRILRQHNVQTAASGEEAKALLEQDQSYELIICDMMMPYMSGMDLHRWLQESHPGLAERFVFITGGAFTPKSKEYLNAVNTLCIDKPFDAVELKELVAKLIVTHRERELISPHK